MTQIVDILDSYLSLAPRDKDQVSRYFSRIDTDALTLRKQSSMTGGGTGYADGNIEINVAGGVTLYNPSTGRRVIHLDSDGDAWFGNDTSEPAKTALSIFSNAQPYNSESMGEGDLLMGDNSSGKANVLWDRSTGQMLFRGGQTTHAYVDTDGSMKAGGGKVRLDNTGVWIQSGTDEGGVNSYNFWADTATTAIGWWYVHKEVAGDYTGALRVAQATAGKDSLLTVSASAGANDLARTELLSTGGSSTAYVAVSGDDSRAAGERRQVKLSGDWIVTDSGNVNFNIKGGLYVGSDTSKADTGGLWATGDSRIGGGLYVGGIGTNPDQGCVVVVNDGRFGGGLSVGSETTNPAAGEIYATADMRIGGGLYVGSLGTDPDADNITADGDIHAGADLSATGDIRTVPWTPWHDDATIVGWTSFTEKAIEYKKIGKLVFVNFRIGGTSNSTSTSFTVPYPEGQTAGNPIFMFRANNNSAIAIAFGQFTAASTVTFYSTAASAAWNGAAVNKTIHGQFFYQTT